MPCCHSRREEAPVPIGRGIWVQSFGRRLRQDRQGSAADAGGWMRPACRRGGKVTPLPAWRNAPHIFFCLGKRKRAAPGTKENRLFIGLLVRPAKTGLVSSSCAKRRAFPERSRRICIAYAESLVQIGLLCATAPLPLSGQKKNVYAPAGKKLATNARPSGSGARGTTGPLCTLRFVPNKTNAA